MTSFMIYFLALVCSFSCLEVSRAFAAGPAAYTTITNTIDIMGAVESAQENNPGGYSGQNIYSQHGGHEIISNSKIRDADPKLTTPDAAGPSETSSAGVNFWRFPSTSGIRAIVASAGPLFSYVATSSGSSISISSAGPDLRTVSYSAPHRIYVSHGSPGSSYVLSAYPGPQTQKAVFSSSSPSAEKFEDRNQAAEDGSLAANDKIQIQENSGHISSSSYSSSSSSSSGLRNGAAVAVFGIPDSRLSIPSIIDLADMGQSVATGILHGNEYPAYAAAAARSNLQAARQVVDGISAAVSRAVDINLARFGAGQLL